MTTRLQPTERILLLGDIHGSLWQAEQAIKEAEATDCDTIVQLGDFGIWPGDAGARFRKRLDKLLGHWSMHLYFVDGNHEDFPQLYKFKMNDDGTRHVGENISHLPRGYRWDWHGVSFLAMGGAHSVDRPVRVEGETWWPEEWLTDEDVMKGSEGGPVDVLISHDSPTDAPNRIVDGNVGAQYFPAEELAKARVHRKQLQKTVDWANPYLIFHGHYHALMSGTFTTKNGRICRCIGFDEGGNFAQAHAVFELPQIRQEIEAKKKEIES